MRRKELSKAGPPTHALPRARHLPRAGEGVFTLGEPLDEARPPLEQLRELVDRQLPR